MAQALQAEQVQEKTILVVEDDPSLNRAWHRLLKGLPGVTCHVSENALAALNWLEHNSADVLLTDITMPKMNGLDLIRLVQKKYPGMKVIATSAHIQDVEGVDMFLHIIKKPYKNIETLKALLALFLESSQEISQIELKDPQGSYVWDL